MGMGLLGAMGGLGQAGMDVGKQMMQAALREDELQFLEKKQMAIMQAQEGMKIAAEDRADARLTKQRGDIASMVNGVDLPEGSTEKDRALAVASALQGKGLLSEGDHFYRRAKDIERSDYDKSRIESAEKRDSERFAIQNAREERMAKAQEQSLRIQSASASRAAEDQKFQRTDRANKEKATGMLAGYKISKDRGLDDAASVYLENALGLGVDPRMIDKNDPLSSQVSAAKAVLADLEATDEQKSAARQVLTLANGSYIDRRGGAAKPSASLPKIDTLFPVRK